METQQYRYEFRACQMMRARARYHLYLHPQTEVRRESQAERCDELWTREAIEQLARDLEATPPHLETERAALNALLNSARENYIEKSVRHVKEEIKRCEEHTQITWKGVGLDVRAALESVAVESDADARRELAARVHDAMSACDDLRVALYEEKNQIARSLNFASLRDFEISRTPASGDALAHDARAILDATAATYDALWRHVAVPLSGDQTSADHDFLFLTQRENAQYTACLSDAWRAYQETLAGLGIRLTQQTNLHTERNFAQHISPTCFPLDPPDDVRFVFGAHGSLRRLSDFFYTGARAQHYAWTSRELARRYPEFVFAADARATNHGYGFLFCLLLQDELWLAEMCGANQAALIREIIYAAAFTHLHDLRRACAAQIFAATLGENTESDRSINVRSEKIGETYAGLQSEATHFQSQPTQYLRELDHLDLRGDNMRAFAFAAFLNEYLRTRHGRRWWTKRGAGDELIDLWNTASRYHVEEIVKQLGGGELSYDLLVAEFYATINRGA